VDTKIHVTSYKLYSFKVGPIIYQGSSGHAESIYDAL
jgi:hypothetical protein